MNYCRISVVVNTLNEEDNIANCLNSVKGFADEIIVCDMYSEDRTVEIAKSYYAKVIFHDKVGFVEPARNFAINAAQGEWILVLDADEYITDGLKAELLNVVKTNNKADLVKVSKLYFYFTKFIKQGGYFKGSYPLFFRKSLYINSYTNENEKIFKGFTSLTKAAIHVITIDKKYCIMHNAYPDIEKYVIKTDGKYAAIEAKNMFESGVKFSLFNLIFKPIYIFIKKYIFQLCFVEGTTGLILCVLYSQYKFNVWSNLWLLERKNKDPK